MVDFIQLPNTTQKVSSIIRISQEHKLQEYVQEI